MGIEVMGSQGGGGGHQSQFRASGRQSSPYSLTLSEVQNQLGEPLQSMNLDELLRNVLAPEEDQPFTIDLESTFSGMTTSPRLPKALGRKTVDEVWKDIQKGKDKLAMPQRSAKERQMTLGEMTLEDFLVKAGIVAEGSQKKLNGQGSNLGNSVDSVAGSQRYTPGVHWLQQYQPVPSLHQQQQTDESRIEIYASNRVTLQPPSAGMSNVFDSAYEGQKMSSSMIRALSETHTVGRKRVAPEETTEKTVERRQKRMIKNRESAARSRARKQAYTNELENKISRLEEENERLKKQKELETLLNNAQIPQPKAKLSRTSSAPF